MTEAERAELVELLLTSEREFMQELEGLDERNQQIAEVTACPACLRYWNDGRHGQITMVSGATENTLPGGRS